MTSDPSPSSPQQISVPKIAPDLRDGVKAAACDPFLPAHPAWGRKPSRASASIGHEFQEETHVRKAEALPGGGGAATPPGAQEEPGQAPPPRRPASLHTVPHPPGQAPQQAGAQTRSSRGQQAPGQRPEAQGRRGVTLEWTGSLTLLFCFVLTQSCWLGPVGGRTQGQPAAKEAGVARMSTAGEGGS